MLKNLAIGTIAALALTFVAPNTTSLTAADTKDIVDTAVAAGSFKTLVKALAAADLVTTLKGKGPFTVFAPTDEAFAKLPAGTVETLLTATARDRSSGNVGDMLPCTTRGTLEGRIHRAAFGVG
jgi:uncharacterized surface protein with fasciclin (FAS1) repeats